MGNKWVAAVVLVSFAAAGTAVGLRQGLHPQTVQRQNTGAHAPLHAFNAREVAARGGTLDHLDAALASLARHVALGRVHPGRELSDLHALNPAARFRASAATGEPQVLVDAVTRGDPRRLQAALVDLGLEHPSLFSNDVSGWLPLRALAAAAANGEVHALRAAMPHTRVGAVTSQGDYAQHSDVVRSTYPTLTGSGVTVGLLSDSFDCYAVYANPANKVPVSGYAGYAYNGFSATQADDVASGDLPAGVKVLAEANCLSYGAPFESPFGDEGRAMAQIVHDVAPGAAIAFHTAENGEADFAAGIQALASGGAQVIADDVGYYDEPFFQDGLVAQAIDAVTAQGVSYFSAAGNDGTAQAGGSDAYSNTAPAFGTTAATGPNAGESLLNFDQSLATTVTSLPVTLDALQPGQFVAIVVEWDQPFVTGAANSGGATSQIDLCVTGSGADTIYNDGLQAASCTGPNALGADPVQVMIVGNPANAVNSTVMQTVNVTIGLAGGTPAPGRIKLVVETDGQQSAAITSFVNDSATMQGHPTAAGAAAVGAAFFFDTPRCGATAATLESFSSFGGSPILFDVAGTRLAAPTLRQKPQFVAPDGGNDTFLGFTLATAGITGGKLATTITQCQNDPGYPNFFGTSAATPHAAAIAALMRQANPAATPAQIVSALQQSALPMGTAPSLQAGYGFVQADAALALIPAGVPQLTLAADTVVAGTATTITWSSVNTTGCTASGAWSGALGVTGSQSVSQATAGTYAYSLACANAAGASSPASVTLTVTAAVAPQGGGHGGGALELRTLLGLSALALCLRRRRRSPRVDVT